jgi:pre-mRNA-processing factor 19
MTEIICLIIYFALCVCQVWKAGSNDKYSEALSVAPVVGAEVASLAVHPTGHYAASAHSDGSWALLDLRGEAADTDRAVIYRVPTPDASSAYLCNAFHPDGLIVGCGTNNGVVKIWDARDKSNVGNCQATTTLASSDVSTSAVNSLSYSENGYLLAAGYAGGMVRLWDLRKLKCTKEFQSE